MSGPYAAHLASLPCVWINLDESVERREAWTRLSAPLFHSAYRLRATPVSEVPDERFEAFIAGWKRTVHEVLPRIGTSSGEMFIQRGGVPKMKYDSHTRRAQCALTESHVRALRWGLDAGWDRFVVSEDDAVPRSTAYDLLTPVPPSEADIAVHGGALAMAGHASDNTRFVQRRPHRWVPIARPFNSLCATVYEVTRRGAKAVVRAVEEHPMLIDHTWGFAFLEVSSFAIYPNIFPQAGRSTRNNTVHTPTLTR